MFNLKDKISKRIHPWPLIKYDLRKSYRGFRSRKVAEKFGEPINCHGADHIHFYATLACDKNCDFCINKVLADDGVVPGFAIKRIEDQLSNILNRMYNFREIVINGGEPFIWAQLPEMLNMLHYHNVTVFTALPSFATAIKELRPGNNNIILKVSYHPNEGHEPINQFVDRLKQIPEGIIWNPHVIKTPGTSGRVYMDGFRKYGIYATVEELIQPDYSNIKTRPVRCKPNEHIIAPDLNVYRCLVHMLKKEGGVPVDEYEFKHEQIQCDYYPKCAPCIGFQEVEY